MPEGTRDDGDGAERELQGEQPAGEEAEGDVVREAIALTKRIEELKLELTPLEDKLKALQPKLVAEFEKSGDQRRTVDGKTAYLRRDLWVKPSDGVDKDSVAAALKQAGFEDFVKETFNIQSISALAREVEKDVDWEETGALLEDAEHPFLTQHPELKGVLTPIEAFSVRIVKA